MVLARVGDSLVRYIGHSCCDQQQNAESLCESILGIKVLLNLYIYINIVFSVTYNQAPSRVAAHEIQYHLTCQRGCGAVPGLVFYPKYNDFEVLNQNT